MNTVSAIQICAYHLKIALFDCTIFVMTYQRWKHIVDRETEGERFGRGSALETRGAKAFRRFRDVDRKDVCRVPST